MEDEDDDFGGLYADVEVEAISAINVGPQLSNSQFVNIETGKQNDDKIDIASGDADNGNDDDDDYDDDDDDDDDLDIVLNSGDGITVVRNNANLGSREIDDAEDDNLRTEEFAGGIAVANSHSMYKYLRPQPAAYGSDLKVSRCVTTAYLSQEDNGYSQRMGSRSMGPQSVHRFSLPWSRNILDVNIDIFEQKPWKNPGVDITDYFNFGFDEDSWKLYCNQVDEYRHRGLMNSWTLASEPAQLTDVDWREGRAIEVEESIVERQSTMDVRGHMDRDSDAIHICILDPGEHLNSSVPETSNQRDVSGDDDDMGHLSFSIDSEDESVVGSHLEMGIQAPKRSSNRKISSKLVRRSSENHEIYQVSEGSGGTVEAIRFSNNSKDTCTTDPSMLVAESSEPAKSSASYLVDSKRSDYKTEHGRNNYHAKHSSPVYNNRNHGETKHRHHDVNDDSYSRRVGDEREHVDHKYHSRCNSHVYNNRPHRDFNPKSLHENDIYSRRTYDQRKTGEHRHHARNSNPVYNLETYHENDDYFSMSRIEGTYAVESTIDHERWIERLHSFDPYNEEKIYLKSELPSDYYSERSSSYEHWVAERYGTEMDQSVFRSSEEEEYCDEQRRYIDDNRMMEGHWCLNERGSQWQRREHLFLRNKGENDDLYLEREYSDYMPEKQFGSLTYNGRERDEVEHGCEKNIAHTRWDFRGAGRKKIRVSSPSSELNNSLLKRDEYIASQSSEESHINNGRWHGNIMPRDSLSRRHGRFRAQYSEPVDTGDYMIDIDGHVNMKRTRQRWQYEMQSEEDDILFRREDAKFYAERTLLPFEKVARHKMFVSDHVESVDDPREWLFMGGAGSPDLHLVGGYDHVELLTDGPCAKRDRYRHKKEVYSGNKFAKPHGESYERLSPSCRNSLDSHLVVGEGKSSEKHIKPKWMDFNSCLSDKVARTVKSKAKDKGLDIKEGQILTKEVNIGPIKGDTMAHVNDVKKLQNHHGEKGLDNTRILEAMAKMEKRRARFNEPVTTSRKDSDTAGDSVHEAALNKQHRPARKRRWGGS